MTTHVFFDIEALILFDLVGVPFRLFSSFVSKFRNLSRHKADEKFLLDHPRDSTWAASSDELLQRVKQIIGMECAWFRSFGPVTESTVVLMYPRDNVPYSILH
jgi:hypothetical protein